MNAQQIIADYIAAYASLHGQAPQVVQHGKRHRFRVITASGECSDYTARDMVNLTRGLIHLASKGD